MAGTNDPAGAPRASTGASRPRRRSIGSEFIAYLMQNKKWWMIPILVMILLLAIVLLFGSSPAAPFIYPLF
jgi:hypothetical protein